MQAQSASVKACGRLMPKSILHRRPARALAGNTRHLRAPAARQWGGLGSARQAQIWLRAASPSSRDPMKHPG
jgi:hypothetical protein